MSAVHEWIRPWYPTGWEGHISPDCPELLKWVSEPVEGPGWLDPNQGINCTTCIPSWNAECGTCDASLDADENHEDDGPFTEAEAKAWKRDHRCFPLVRVIAPPTPGPEPIPAGQFPLF